MFYNISTTKADASVVNVLFFLRSYTEVLFCSEKKLYRNSTMYGRWNATIFTMADGIAIALTDLFFNPINFSLEQNILVVSRQAFILY